MKELGRIVSNRRFLAGVLLLLLVNGVLFVREQRENQYGLDLELPKSGTVLLDGLYMVEPEPADAREAYRRYLSWLDRVRGLSADEAEAFLNGVEKAGTADDENARLDAIAVNNLLAQVEYLTGYDDWLEGIRKNKENLLDFSIFSDPDSFSGRNIRKTADEFEKLRGVELTLGADGAVDALLSYRLADYFLTVFLLLFGLSFLGERKTGLWAMVHASPDGRFRLAVRRTLLLCGASVCGVLLFHGTDLALGFSLYGGSGDLDRAVQSVETLGKLPVLTTVGGFLVRFFLLRFAAAFFVGLLLWLLLTAINNVKYTVVAAALALAAEYGLYTFLPVQSAFNLLKYCNLFTYISLSDLYTKYLNVDLFGFPLGIRSVSQIALLPLCLLTAAACVALHCRKKPAAGRDLLGKAAYGINSVTDRILRRLRLFGMELYKTLWIQRGAVIAALLVYAVFGLSYAVKLPVTSFAEQAAKRYTAEFAGEITDETLARMDAEQAALNGKLAAYEEAQFAYAVGEMDFSHFDVFAREASSAEIDGEGLAMVRSRVEELRTFGREKGFTPYLLDETPFESVYGGRAQEKQHRAALTALLALTLLLAGSMSCERQSGMTYLLRSTARGRGTLLLRKLLLAAVVTTLVWAVVYGRELYTLLTDFSVSAWNAPARNLSMLTAFPLSCSVAWWLVLLYACRWLALFCCAVVLLFLSRLVKRTEVACVAGVSVLLLPSALYAYLGIGVFRPLALVLPVEVMPLLTAANGAVSAYLLWLAALAGLASLLIGWLFVIGEKTPFPPK